ncbi:VQ motif-containing protein 11 [Aristolochia californica]|uniref:VQ motif-containing protein 11 n=1 Tax=Aristolochia californica TaxID=171875 RepID=UPI0035DE2CD1
MASPPSDPPPPLTTFVQADPATFRALVQKLTGSNSSSHPHSPGSARSSSEHPIGPRKSSSFKLHERRQSMRKLEIKLSSATSHKNIINKGGGANLLVSPVSPLDHLSSFSPKTPTSPCLTELEEERAIAEKGFYLHPSLINTPRRGGDPELLPLFPLHSPR